MGLASGAQQNCMKCEVGWSLEKVGYQLALVCLQLSASLQKHMYNNHYAILCRISTNYTELLIFFLRNSSFLSWMGLRATLCGDIGISILVYQFSECFFIFLVFSAFIGLSIQPSLFLELVGNGWFFFLQLPGKRPLGWTVQAKVDVYLWLGPASYAHSIMENLPVGYETEVPSNTGSEHSIVPSPACLRYKSKALFLLYSSRAIVRGLVRAS